MQVVLSVCLVHLLAVASPGPDFLLILRNSLLYTRGVAIWTAAGIATGVTLHVTYSIFGLGWLQNQFPELLLLLRYCSALYLLYLGWKTLQIKKLVTLEEAEKNPNILKVSQFILKLVPISRVIFIQSLSC